MDKRQIFQSMADAIERGPVEFSSGARQALGLRSALADPSCHAARAAQLISAEPVLAARVVAMANSLAYNPLQREINDLTSAITRLGFATLRSLCMALFAKRLAGPALPSELQALTDQLWLHTVDVAALARVIARRVTQVDPEAALFAGVMHEVPGFYLLSHAAAYPGLLDGDCSLWYDEGEALLGRALLEALDLPASVRQAIDTYWEGYLAMPPTSLGDTLLLAEQLAPTPSPLHQGNAEYRLPNNPAALDCLVGEHLLSDILAEAREEVSSLQHALGF
ncbi:HDOD domain-containing protein [Azonexus sp.]|uniref:HDOD domain-containing protein n=1 Tax=Azonexus sp. TaxID=1872668 RepID=UPI0039E51376